MNEEIKIIIKAVTDTAKKSVSEVRKEVERLQKEGGNSSKGFSAAMSKISGAAKVAAGVAVAAFAAISTALIALGKSTAEYREQQARLNAAFQAAGGTAETASKAYKGLYRFLGDSDQASEAAAHLAQLTTDQKELAEWTAIAQGVYATFGKSLPIESLTEAINETAKVGTVTGGLADALNWAGISEDAFNASLAATSSLEEREALIRGTLNGIYMDAANIYEKNNQEIIKQNEAQANLDATTGRLGKTVTPLITAFINLSNALLTALAPAISFISSIFTKFINKIVEAIQWVSGFFGILSGDKASVEVVGGISENVSSAATGAQKLGGGFKAAKNEAEKLKKATAGFDELNVLSSGSSPTAAPDASGGSNGGGANLGNFNLGTDGLDSTLENGKTKISGFVSAIKTKIAELKTVFAPTIEAWSGAFNTIKESFNNSISNFAAGGESIKNGFASLGSYLIDEFIPNVVNSFSTNLAPIFGDVIGFSIEELGRNFEFLGGIFERVVEEMIKPALETIETITTDVFDIVGGAWQEHGADILKQAERLFEGLRQSFTDFYDNLILPIWNNIKNAVDKLWKESLEPLVSEVVDAALEIGECILQLWNDAIKPWVDKILDYVYPIIADTINKIVNGVLGFAGTVADIFAGVIKVIKGIIQFITGVFTGDWKKAWEGVKNILKGVFDSLVAIVKVPLNLIISAINVMLRGFTDGVNTAIRAINKINVKVPDWIPGIGGKEFGFNLSEVKAPQIPKLARGGIVGSATTLIAGEAGREAILPLERNTEWMDMLADKIAERNDAPTKIVLALDSKELGWANIRSINSITKQTGSLQLTLA